ncbi:MAG: acetyltransferase (the isoleucine patch superfamily) [uncultured bacterium]|nr:MAG: acetyltransferase (the isoleucine patch superfamily) [uncultured bacterium]HBH17955.1 hypothetical protein [Cyanobacteria bacterium UBA9579]
MKQLIIYGAGFLDIIKLIDAINEKKPEWQIIGFLDDQKEEQGKVFLGHPVLGGKELIPELIKNKNIYFINNCYDEAHKFRDRADLLDHYICKVPNLIHPSIDMRYVKIGKGCILPEGCVVGGGTEIGNYVTVRLKSLISHDVKIEDYSFIGPGVTIGGCAVLKEDCFIGAGTTVLHHKIVGEKSKVGAGAVVTQNISDGITVVGVPAKKIKRNFFKRVYRYIKKRLLKIISLLNIPS